MADINALTDRVHVCKGNYIPDDLQSDIRMEFSRATNNLMEGDGGWFIDTKVHAYDLLTAIRALRDR